MPPTQRLSAKEVVKQLQLLKLEIKEGHPVCATIDLFTVDINI